jgi:hypothetical protein
MAKLHTRFDATAHDTEQRAEFEDLPTGIYKFEIEASEIKETGPEGARTGCGMKYTANVVAPEALAGRKFFGFINLENANAQAQEIGQREFASLCRAMELDGADDTEDTHFRPYTVKLRMGKPSKKLNADGTPMYPARVEVGRYFFPDEGELPEPAIDDVQPVKAPVAAANDNAPASRPAAAPAAKPAGSKPWAKKAA